MLSHLPDVLRPISLLDIKDDSSNSKKKIEGRNAKVTKNKVICIESPLHSELQKITLWAEITPKCLISMDFSKNIKGKWIIAL